MYMEIYFPGGKKVYADHDGTVIKTDQPATSGGEESAPTPFELFIASMGTCAGFYVLDFLQSRNLPADKAKLKLRAKRSQETHLMESILMEIQLPPDFPEKYREAVVKAAAACLVAKHFKRPPEIKVIAV